MAELDAMGSKQPEDGALPDRVLGGQLSRGDAGLVVGHKVSSSFWSKAGAQVMTPRSWSGLTFGRETLKLR